MESLTIPKASTKQKSLLWVLGSQKIRDNEEADILAIEGDNTQVRDTS